jgi:hypothetical protein
MCMGAIIFKVNHYIVNAVSDSPTWLYYSKRMLESLPNALWLFATLNVYRYFYRNHTFFQNLFWLSLITTLAFSTEYVQAFTAGNFDPIDLLAYEYASLVTMYLTFRTQLCYLYADIK